MSSEFCGRWNSNLPGKFTCRQAIGEILLITYAFSACVRKAERMKVLQKMMQLARNRVHSLQIYCSSSVLTLNFPWCAWNTARFNLWYLSPRLRAFWTPCRMVKLYLFAGIVKNTHVMFFMCSTKCAGLFSLKISPVIEILIVPLSVLQLRKIFKSLRSWQFLAGTQDQDILFVYPCLKAHLRFFTTL